MDNPEIQTHTKKQNKNINKNKKQQTHRAYKATVPQILEI